MVLQRPHLADDICDLARMLPSQQVLADLASCARDPTEVKSGELIEAAASQTVSECPLGTFAQNSAADNPYFHGSESRS